MSDSTEDLKNIDSYGVWVKRPPQDAEGIPEDTAAEPIINAEEVSIEEPVIPEDLSFDTIENDSTLSDEEVSDIKNDVSEPEQKSEDTGTDDFFKDELPDFSDLGASEPENNASDDTGESEISLDDFVGAEGFEDPNKAFEPKTENVEPAEKAEEPAAEESVDATSFDDGELSLDDFMDGGFSDETPSAPASSSGSDEISLDDFFDTDTSSAKEDDVSNDEPLDIDLSFTENPEDKVPTEETDISADDEDPGTFAEDDMFDNISAEQSEDGAVPSGISESTLDSTTEEVSLDDFGIDENSDDATAVAAGASVNSHAESEDVDLSDFGIDSEAGETPVKQDVHASKKKVVDYDIAITDDDSISEAPKAEEVVTSDRSDGELEPVEDDKNSVKVDSSMLDMIMQELSGLKNQINSLKDEFQTLKENKPEIQPETEIKDENEAETAETEIPAENTEESTGFFDENDNDDTIALSGDELSNIMNTADITETKEEPLEPENTEISEDFSEEPEVKVEPEEAEGTFESNGEIPAEAESEPTLEETVIPESEEISAEEEISPETEQADETEISEITENSGEEESSTGTPEDFNEDSPFGSIDETSSIEEEPDSGLSMNSDEEKLEEPNLDEINIQNMEDEISIPKVDELADDADTPLDDILVESSNSDLMNSVDEKETPAPEMPEDIEATESAEPADEIAEPAEDFSESEKTENPEEEENKIFEDFISEDPKVSESISDENIDYLNADKSDSEEKTEESDDAEEIPETEPEVTMENEEPVPSETIEPEEIPSDSDEETADAETKQDDKQLPDDLKNDVKSVLLYMDQLLENLPEDKIMEFAKSEQFSTYKKLFSELGLSN